MRTLFIGEFGSGDLANEAALIEAIGAYPSDTVLVLSANPGLTRRSAPMALVGDSLDALHTDGPFDRVVVAGPIVSEQRFEEAMAAAAQVQAAEGSAIIHNLTLPRTPKLLKPSDAVLGAVRKMASISARDHRTLELMAEWQLHAVPRLAYYPERTLVPDHYLLSRLEPGPVLGLALRATVTGGLAWEQQGERIRALLAQFPDHAVLPLVSVGGPDRAGQEDAAGFKAFTKAFLPEARVVLPEMLDGNWWMANVTPQRLKGLISRCKAVIAQRDLPAALAIECGVRTIGLAPRGDDRAMRAISTLANFLPKGSASLVLPFTRPLPAAAA